MNGALLRLKTKSFVGLANYAALLKDNVFWQAMKTP